MDHSPPKTWQNNRSDLAKGIVERYTRLQLECIAIESVVFLLYCNNDRRNEVISVLDFCKVFKVHKQIDLI